MEDTIIYRDESYRIMEGVLRGLILHFVYFVYFVVKDA
jgi:hypothetical protein